MEFGATSEHQELSPGINLGLAKSEPQVEIWEWEPENSGMRLDSSMRYQHGGSSGVNCHHHNVFVAVIPAVDDDVTTLCVTGAADVVVL